ncbi:hypothetical protein [Bradyrhizobium sp. UFLA03-84]|nr:hypothetical protein [Bradyrhizobium sp. UFLA03-84]
MKVQPPTLVFCSKNPTFELFVTPNVAVPVGTVAGVQLAALLKSNIPK